jgi:plasmid stability protein
MTLEFEISMDINQSRSTQVVLPEELYQAIEHRAKVHGCSISSEILMLLAQSLDTKIEPNLADEFVAWETASDEDWLKMEALLTGQEP